MNNSKKPYRVDVHHRAIPKEVIDSFNQIGITEIGGIPFSLFNEEKTLAFMDRGLIKYCHSIFI